MRKVYAKDLEVGNVLAGNAAHGPISIKEITRCTNPIHRTLEIKVRGPLGIVEKFAGDALVTIF